jgi:hypothetical protein
MPWLEEIRCDRCGFRSNTSFWGYFRYRLPDGTLMWVKRCAGWCNSCENTAPIEDLPNVSEVNTKLGTCQVDLKRLEDFFIRKHFGSGRRKRRELATERQDLRNTLRFLELRKGNSRCLRCGSTDIFPVDIGYPENGQEVGTSFRHPSCGGALFRIKPTVHFIIVPTERIYDVEGNLLSEERCE